MPRLNLFAVEQPTHAKQTVKNNCMTISELQTSARVARRPSSPPPRTSRLGRRRGVGLDVRTGPAAFDGIAPRGDLPLNLHVGQRGRLRQVDLDALPGGLDVADVHQAGQGRGPEAGDRAAAGVERKVLLRPL